MQNIEIHFLYLDLLSSHNQQPKVTRMLQNYCCIEVSEPQHVCHYKVQLSLYPVVPPYNCGCNHGLSKLPFTSHISCLSTFLTTILVQCSHFSSMRTNLKSMCEWERTNHSNNQHNIVNSKILEFRTPLFNLANRYLCICAIFNSNT